MKSAAPAWAGGRITWRSLISPARRRSCPLSARSSTVTGDVFVIEMVPAWPRSRDNRHAVEGRHANSGSIFRARIMTRSLGRVDLRQRERTPLR